MITQYIRTLALGPEDPVTMTKLAYDILATKAWEFRMANGLGGSLCGSMVLFLIFVYFWRPILVNRVSLRLIFAISIYDFIQCLIQALSNSSPQSANCRATMFFSTFFGYTSVYTSSSIATNLYFTLLGGGIASIPKYAEYLYFGVPITVSLLHWAPPAIWAAKHGYCSAFDPINPGTNSYIIYVVFVQLLLPFLSLMFNIYVSARVIVMLLVQQRQISRSLKTIADSTREYLLDSSIDSQTRINQSSTKCEKQAQDTRRSLERSLLVMHKVNSAAIRIALYPCAPIAWWIINTIFYSVQYSLTLTYKSDVDKMVYIIRLAWFSIPAIAFANFLIFVTDPAFVKVHKEVRRCILGRFVSSSSQIFSKKTGKQSTRTGSTTINNIDHHCTLVAEDVMPWSSKVYSPECAADCSTMYAGSLLRNSFESRFTDTHFEQGAATSYSSATLTAYGELVRRHPTVGNGADANTFYSRM